MNRWLKPLALLSLAAQPALAIAQTDGLKPAQPAAIAASAASCAAALSPSGVDEPRLVADGWQEGSVNSGGKAVATPLRFFGRGNTVLLLMREEKPASPNCVIMARMKSVRDFPAILQATGAALGGKLAGTGNGSAMWLLSGGKAAQIQATGSRSKPAVRVVVVQTSGGK
jgi:hypothetical protein